MSPEEMMGVMGGGGMPPGGDPMGYVPPMDAPADPSMAGMEEPAPEEFLGAEPPPDVSSVLLWVPFDPEVVVDDHACAAIGGIAVADESGKTACLAAPEGEQAPIPPGFVPASQHGANVSMPGTSRA